MNRRNLVVKTLVTFARDHTAEDAPREERLYQYPLPARTRDTSISMVVFR
jgi:hypothetical protein